jgi:hypothetical protein
MSRSRRLIILPDSVFGKASAPATYVRRKLREPTELGSGHVCYMLLGSQNSVGWPPSLEVQTGRCPATVQGSTSCGGGCVMRRNRGWARARPHGAHIMRLGAWYKVVGNTAPNLVILEIARRNVAIPRDLLQISSDRPERFSVVRRSPSNLGGKSDDSASTYAVCPVSGTRVPLSGHPESIECPSCGHRGSVDWEELA